MKLAPVLEYCECGCKCVVPYCPTCKGKNVIQTQLSDPNYQKFCQMCGTEFDWNNLEKVDKHRNDWRRINRDL
jgi:hypothetical protein